MGLATAKMLIDRGARVLVTGLSKAGLDSAEKEIGKHAIVLASDARSLTDIDALASRVKSEFDTFDLLSVSAGFSIPTPLENVTSAIYDEMFNLNAKGPFFAVQKLAPLINRGGAVVLTTSVANVKGLPGQATYGAAKAALRSFARTLAVELLPREIRVNAVTPDETLRDVGGSREGRPVPWVRRDLHERRRTSCRRRMVSTLTCGRSGRVSRHRERS
jgi:NAD(P)-dependent dehydrogenase (short-subunit alcohol dehydrogenase family)